MGLLACAGGVPTLEPMDLWLFCWISAFPWPSCQLLHGSCAHPCSKSQVLWLPLATETSKPEKIVWRREVQKTLNTEGPVIFCSRLHLLNAGVNSICLSRVPLDINRGKWDQSWVLGEPSAFCDVAPQNEPLIRPSGKKKNYLKYLQSYLLPKMAFNCWENIKHLKRHNLLSAPAHSARDIRQPYVFGSYVRVDYLTLHEHCLLPPVEATKLVLTGCYKHHEVDSAFTKKLFIASLQPVSKTSPLYPDNPLSK